MDIRREEILHIAALSRLALNEEQLADTSRAIAEILEYMKSVENAIEDAVGDGADTPAAQPSCPLREDTVCESLSRTSLLRAAARHTQDMLVVPKTVE